MFVYITCEYSLAEHSPMTFINVLEKSDHC